MNPLKTKNISPLIISILLICSVANVAVASVHPTPSPPPLSEEDKILESTALLFLTNVVNIKTSSYLVDVRVANQAPGVLNGKTLHFNLSSANSQLEVIAEFSNSNLFWISIYATKGPVLLNNVVSSNILTTAKDTLAQLQTFSARDYLPTFQRILNNVDKLQNSKITIENYTQEIATKGNTMSISWEPYANGLSNPQNKLYLEFTDGYLTHYSDYLGRNKIGSSQLTISAAQAIQIAVDHARNFSYVQDNITVSNFDILEDRAVANASLRTRGDNTLFPCWSIIVPLAKEYPGGVGYFRVIMWADTGEITYFSPMGSFGGLGGNDSNAVPSAAPKQTQSPPTAPSENSNTTNGLMIGSALVAVVIISVAGYLFYKRKR